MKKTSRPGVQKKKYAGNLQQHDELAHSELHHVTPEGVKNVLKGKSAFLWPHASGLS